MDISLKHILKIILLWKIRFLFMLSTSENMFDGGKQLKLSDIDERANSEAYLGCTYKQMRDVYINVVFKNEQDINDGVTFDRFVLYEINVEGQRYCLAPLDYIDIPY